MRTVNHRFALSSPALPSASDKKLFSSVNCPIFACSVFTSTGGSFDGVPAASNTSTARSSSCRFHSVIWFGCTSNSCASSASLRSALTTASATFASNAAECVRQVLSVIFLVSLPALSLAQAPGIPLTQLFEFARSPLQCLRGMAVRSLHALEPVDEGSTGISQAKPRCVGPSSVRQPVRAQLVLRTSLISCYYFGIGRGEGRADLPPSIGPMGF
ncbi:hypothetical protein Y048_4317 [Burkholderia pseudomallei MSHR456]|nr:hypothetical protein Y048_4317 [Burkholderia pseudomallei MSHR456]